MNKKHIVGLTSSEISGLWSSYISNSIAVCLSKHFLKYIEDKEAKPLVSEFFENTKDNLEKIKNIFIAENFPIPRGYSEEEEDLDLSAPALFFDLFPLSYVYAQSRMDLVHYTSFIASSARPDIRVLFSKLVTSSLNLFNKSTDLMLSKGIYDRPAFIPYPDHIEFLKKKGTFLPKWFEENRTLSVLELSEIFFNIERNYYGLALLTAFAQVVKDNKIKQYLLRGKKLANKQIQFYNETLIKDELLGTIMVNTEVTTSTTSPFSDRLILGVISLSNSAAISFTGSSLSSATRIDLTTEYSKLLAEIMKYGKEGMDLLIEREWMEEPPHAPDRKKLVEV